MKTKMLFVAVIAALFLSFPMYGQPAHPNGGSTPGSGNQPVGGGSAPLGGGLAVMLTLASVYGAKKIAKFRSL